MSVNLLAINQCSRRLWLALEDEISEEKETWSSSEVHWRSSDSNLTEDRRVNKLVLLFLQFNNTTWIATSRLTKLNTRVCLLSVISILAPKDLCVRDWIYFSGQSWFSKMNLILNRFSPGSINLLNPGFSTDYLVFNWTSDLFPGIWNQCRKESDPTWNQSEFKLPSSNLL